MNKDVKWGERVVKMMIFFDNVRCIPENRQQGKNAAPAADRRSTRSSTTGMSRWPIIVKRMFGKPGVNFAEKLDCCCPAGMSKRNQLLHTCPQASTDKFLNDSGVKHVNPAISREMPNSIVLGRVPAGTIENGHGIPGV